MLLSDFIGYDFATCHLLKKCLRLLNFSHPGFVNIRKEREITSDFSIRGAISSHVSNWILTSDVINGASVSGSDRTVN